MSFAELNSAVKTFMEGVRIHVSTSALAEVNTRPPATANDEVAFLRLTRWSYSLIFEAGRTCFTFLLALGPPQGDGNEHGRHAKTVETVRNLRTWFHHNLGFESDRELKIRREVSDWFIASCGTISPTTSLHWEQAFTKLCSDVHSLVSYGTDQLSAILCLKEDKEQIMASWRRRVQRDWPAQQFDGLIADSAMRIGAQINSRALRERRLADWRRYLECIPEDEDPMLKMESLIDSEVLNHLRERLPLSSKDLMMELQLDPGPEVRTALQLARDGFEMGLNNRTALLEFVRERWSPNDRSDRAATNAIGPTP